MTNTFNFTDRATYLAWVKAWKATYAEASQLVRDTKAEMKIAAREGRSAASDLQARREYLRKDQRDAITARHEAKEEAQRQYIAALEARQAA